MEILSDGQDDGGRGRAGVLPRGKTRAWVRFSSWELWFSFVMFSDLRRGMRSRNGSAVAVACAVLRELAHFASRTSAAAARSRGLTPGSQQLSGEDTNTDKTLALPHYFPVRVKGRRGAS
jgi:hypothetical protein